MEISYVLKDCTFKHNKYSVVEAETWKDKDLDIVVAKGEKFAFQIMLKATEEFNCTIDKSSAISWKGLGNRVRLALNVPNSLENNFSINILGYVQDDTKAFVNDAILRDKDMLVEQYLPQTFWVEGQVPEDFEENNFNIGIDIFKSFGYEDEEKACTIDVPVEVK
ncbi:hypothetical protein BM533_21815, partial [Clostridioides difficile]